MGWSTVEALSPEAELLLQQLTLEPLPLPERVIRILYREILEGGRLVLHERRIELTQLVVENAQRPAVGDDVVHGQQKNMLIGGQSQQRGSPQWIFRQHEETLCVFIREALDVLGSVCCRQT